MKTLFTLFFVFTLSFTESINHTFNYILVGDNFLEGLVVYPNPSSNGNISISFSSLHKHDKIQIKIISLIGKEVYLHTLHNYTGKYNAHINLERVAKGIYMLEVTDGEQKETRRFSIT